MSIEDDKARLRETAKARRKQAVADAGPEGPARFAERVIAVLGDLGIGAGSVGAGYWAMANELDVTPLMERLHGEFGVTCALPVVVGNERPLVFRRWTPGMALEAGGFGTHHPPADAPEVRPDVLFVPMLAFDTQGYRLGWGGGFYDRTLETLRADGRPVIAVGCAYAGQQMDNVAHDAHDQPLDWIATDRGVIRAEAACAS